MAPLSRRTGTSWALVFALMTYTSRAWVAVDYSSRSDRRCLWKRPLTRRTSRTQTQRKIAESFDFSSTSAWEVFYKREAQQNSLTEWHSSISMDTLVSIIPSNATSIVMVGCGSSELPSVVQQCHPSCEQLTLLDSSETCLQTLKNRYGDSMSYACGDATQLSQVLSSLPVDVIYDKGLMDALFCDEGWNGPIADLLEEAGKVLNDQGGVYILISYRLPSSTQEFLAQVGKANQLEWQFDLPESNARVGVSVARKLGKWEERVHVS